MRSTIAWAIVLGGLVATAVPSAQTKPASATATDIYHVHFTKAAPGQADALGKTLVTPDKSSPMPEHFIVLCGIRKGMIGTTQSSSTWARRRK